MNIPILYCIFNRLETTKQTFEPIRQAKPKKLYIASDGPKHDKQGEDKLVQEVRDYVLSQIDWDCEVYTRFQEKNIGCEFSIYGAIKWMFEKEEFGIILEDDILTNQSFFDFMEKMYDKYKNDGKIAIISGYNKLKKISKNDYEFVSLVGTWGFGLFKNVVDLFEFNPEKSIFDDNYLYNLCVKNYNQHLSKGVFNTFLNIHQWDSEFSQLILSLTEKGYRSIVPTVSLSSHITSSNALHFINSPYTLTKLQKINTENLIEPENKINKEYSDTYYTIIVYMEMIYKYCNKEVKPENNKEFLNFIKNINNKIRKARFKKYLHTIINKNKITKYDNRIVELERQYNYYNSFLEFIKSNPNITDKILQ